MTIWLTFFIQRFICANRLTLSTLAVLSLYPKTCAIMRGSRKGCFSAVTSPMRPTFFGPNVWLTPSLPTIIYMFMAIKQLNKPENVEILEKIIIDKLLRRGKKIRKIARKHSFYFIFSSIMSNWGEKHSLMKMGRERESMEKILSNYFVTFPRFFFFAQSKL